MEGHKQTSFPDVARAFKIALGRSFQHLSSLWPHFSFCPQGEQCNVVPDTIDDIVADIGQEEKEEGTVKVYENSMASLWKLSQAF